MIKQRFYFLLIEIFRPTDVVIVKKNKKGAKTGKNRLISTQKISYFMANFIIEYQNLRIYEIKFTFFHNKMIKKYLNNNRTNIQTAGKQMSLK